jgi:hypothetical protein
MERHAAGADGYNNIMDDAPMATVSLIKPPAEPPVEVLPLTQGTLLGVVVALVAVVGEFLLSRTSFWERGGDLVFCVAVAWFGASMGLLSVWLGIGPGRLYLRLLVVGAFLAIAEAILVPIGGSWESAIFAGMALFVVGASAPFGLLWLAGFRTISPASGEAANSSRLDVRRAQVSLRQLFGWTLAAAMVASVAELAQPESFFSTVLLDGLFSFINCGLVLAVLVPASARVATRCVSLAVALVPLAALGLLKLTSNGIFNAEAAIVTIGTSLVYVGLMCLVLLPYRRLGYRYRRLRAGTQ